MMASAVLLIMRMASPCVGMVNTGWQRQAWRWKKAWCSIGFGCETLLKTWLGRQAQFGHVNQIQAILTFLQVQLTINLGQIAVVIDRFICAPNIFMAWMDSRNGVAAGTTSITIHISEL